MKIKSKINDLAARMRGRNPTLHCSFCGKSQHDIAKLIAGPSVHICDGCVGLCDEILGQTPDDPVPVVKIDDLKSMPTDKLLRWLKIQDAALERARAGLDEAVATLRHRDVSWAAIGETLGVSRQAAWDRFS